MTDKEKLKSGYIWDYISGLQVKGTPEEIEAVQPFSKRLVEDFNYPKKQIITHPQYTVRRSPSDQSKSYPVDIAVFNGKPTDENLHMIVECKQKKREDGIEQLKIYLDLCQAQIGVWYNGKSHCYLRKITNKKGINDYKEIPSLPLSGQRLDDVGQFIRKDLKITLNLRSVFKDIRNFIAANTTGVTRDETIASEIINLLFCKIYDEINTAPDEILKFRHGINEEPAKVAERIIKIFEGQIKSEYADVFSKNDTITLDAKTIAYVVGELQMYSITEAQRDIIGEAFEVFIGPALKGSQGQFFTPRNMVRAAVEIINPGPDDRILDPACGSGGFLIVALEHVWDKISAEAKKRGMGKPWIKKREDFVAQNNFRGIEKDSFLSKITKAYMAIVGDGRGGYFVKTH